MARSERDPVFLTREARVRRGVKRNVPVPDPAPGTDWSVLVPGGHQWRILTSRSVFTTGATVANRNVGVRIQDQDGTVWQTQANTVQAAGISDFAQQDGFGPPGQGGSDFATWTAHVPAMWLMPGWAYGSVTNNLQATDQYTGVKLWVEDMFFDDSLLSTRLYNAEDAEYERLTHGG